MSEVDYDTDVLISADWARDHVDTFQADDPADRLVEIESPKPPENNSPSKYGEGHIPGVIDLNWAEDLSDQNESD